MVEKREKTPRETAQKRPYEYILLGLNSDILILMQFWINGGNMLDFSSYRPSDAPDAEGHIQEMIDSVISDDASNLSPGSEWSTRMEWPMPADRSKPRSCVERAAFAMEKPHKTKRSL